MAAFGFGEIAERLRRSTVQVQDLARRGAAIGSGIVWTSGGTIMTNAHVAHGSRAFVTLWDGRSFEGTLSARNARRDLACLQIPTTGLPAADIGDSANVRVGELVIAVGNPLGFIGALTTGVVHSLGSIGALGRQNWIAADVRLAPGNSGGPLADAQGRVIGINTMVAGGLGLAVPSNAAGEFLRAPQSAGRSLGVVVRPIPLRTTKGTAVGMLVLEVAPASPAAESSLLVGDLLIGADGQPFLSLDGLREALDRSGPLLRIQFLRADRKTQREVTVRLNERRPEAA